MRCLLGKEHLQACGSSKNPRVFPTRANELEADWDSVSRADDAMLVNALSMMAPYGAAEKQALLEAPDLKTRAETLVAITEMTLARDGDDFGPGLQ